MCVCMWGILAGVYILWRESVGRLSRSRFLEKEELIALLAKSQETIFASIPNY